MRAPAAPPGRRPACRPGTAPGAVRPRQRLLHKRKGAVPFAFTLSADDTVRTKPHPDPCKAAATRFGVPASACVAVEDSPDGTASAHAAGVCRAGGALAAAGRSRAGEGLRP
ncbi:HAD family hydrolase [Streptomyces globisporus]|uniref:HAD family hydrolase n=1 Tax=Streptomyces globisporus TaxID=1908 RepID=UPI0034612AD0|nr:HAD family hydrolase [Streptomyces globisporus]